MWNILQTKGGTLAAHCRLHTGQRPHRCDVCGATFVHKSHLSEQKQTAQRQKTLEMQSV